MALFYLERYVRNIRCMMEREISKLTLILQRLKLTTASEAYRLFKALRLKYRKELMSKIEVYSDGSGNTFDTDGGWGFVMVVDGVNLKEGSGYLTKATNNVAELQAAIQGLNYADAYIQAAKLVNYEVVLVSDSQLTLGYASGLYKCKAIHLGKLNIELKAVYNKLKAKTRWVKGHSGDEFNEIADQLAGDARANKVGKV